MKPQTMLEYVLEQHRESSNQNEFEDNCYNYAQFLSQKPQKWMFVPCDDEGNVLEEPKWHNEESDYEIQILTQQYQQALERVIFEGFEIFGNTLYIPNLISIKLDKDGKTTDFENLDKLISEFPEYLTLKKPL